MQVTLKALKRAEQTNSSKRLLREDGNVPGVVYGKGQSPESIAVNSVDLVKAIRDQGRNAVFTLEIAEDQAVDVMFHEYQMDPIKSELIHVDFYKADMSEARDVSVPLKLEGEPKHDGILQQPLYEVQVRAKPGDIPEELVMNVSSLEIGSNFTVADLPTNAGYEILDNHETVIATMLQPDAEKEEAQEATFEESAESNVKEEDDEKE
ncbi:50S ribosomal protein L25/general stress protein Ctc [Oceanobacillus bengalensis]|uniref:Large ribosomal subunit protein bL25 n=1 Tax=Oceanobacillus bengalensis TaxID=1435466 RepID=A0A494YUA8_9BACI|nr:50S ribosomal protein L25/general stress protein Ctc [Oceanobacillus bengalensis]RKQ13726.1 50S ribosomal protein L25/general stress protein Ctc [Oceanobacillus bengalensis]